MIFPPSLTAIYVLAKNTEKQEVVEKLQKLGVVHITDSDYKSKLLQGDSSIEGINKISELLLKLNFLCEQTGNQEEFDLTHLPTLEETKAKAQEFLSKHLTPVQELVDKKRRLSKDIERLQAELETLQTLPVDVDVRASKSTHTRVYKSNKATILKVKNGHVSHTPTDRNHFYVISAPKAQLQQLEQKQNQLRRVDLSFVEKTTKEHEVQATKQLEKSKSDLQKATDKLAHILDDRASTLRSLRATMQAYYDQFSIANSFQKTKHFFVLKGYCEPADVEKIKEAIPQALIKTTKADKQAPTKLINNKFTEKFQDVTQLFSTPKTGAADPTAFVSIFFPIFFGFMLSDIGYGILLLLTVFALSQKISGAARRAIPILTFSAVSTIIFGLLFGSFFGGLITIPAILADPFENAQGILIASLAIGLVHMNLAVVIGIVQSRKMKDKWTKTIINYSPFLLIQIAVLIASFQNAMLGGIIGLVALAILIKRGGLLGILDVSGYLGTWFSYARLLALSLATAGVALAVNVIADKALGLGAIGAALWLIIIIVGHLFNFVINLVGTAINSARLHYVEFFGLFFEGGGTPFSPFQLQKDKGGM